MKDSTERQRSRQQNIINIRYKHMGETYGESTDEEKKREKGREKS